MKNTAYRLNEIMKLRGLKQVDILNLAKPYCERYNIRLGKSDLSQFVSGKVSPGQWKLTILGMTLNVSEAWLMGYDVPMDRKMPTPVSESGHSEKDPANVSIDGVRERVITRLCQLSPEDFALVDAFVQGLIAKHQGE